MTSVWGKFLGPSSIFLPFFAPSFQQLTAQTVGAACQTHRWKLAFVLNKRIWPAFALFANRIDLMVTGRPKYATPELANRATLVRTGGIHG